MRLDVALEIVLDLAAENSLNEDETDGNPELDHHRTLQETAINVLHAQLLPLLKTMRQAVIQSENLPDAGEEDPQSWVIRHNSTGLFWAEEGGDWHSLGEAARFTDQEKDDTTLPENGEWIRERDTDGWYVRCLDDGSMLGPYDRQTAEDAADDVHGQVVYLPEN